MTDYLELAAGGEADALWQASRERGVPVPGEREIAEYAGEEITQTGALPLLTELVRAQRQSENAALLARSRSGGEAMTALPDKRLRRGFGETRVPDFETGAASISGGSAEGEDHLWAKRVDLAFQRDSRRYDGQFSLY